MWQWVTNIGSYFNTESEQQSLPMEPEIKQQKLDPPADIPPTSIIWLDDAQTSEENAAVQEELRLSDSNLKLFQDDTQCEQYIREQPDQSQFVLIVNGRLGQKIVPRVHDCPQILSIYIFCLYKDVHEKWSKDFSKVVKVSSQFAELRDEIQTNYFNNIPPVVVPTPTENNEEKCPFFEFDNRYLISDICSDYLSQIEATSDEKDAFIQLYQSIFAEDAKRTENVQIFQESYAPDRALSWFRKDIFFQQILEMMFQTVDTKLMYLCRFLIRDIRNQFEKNNWVSTTTVYRGELMTHEQVRQLTNFQGKIIVMPNFLSTTVNRESAVTFISEAHEHKRVLFEIEANPEIPGAKPFIKIGRTLDFEEDEEVLFMLGSLFKVNEVRDDDNVVTVVKMSLCASEQKNEILSQLSNVNEKKDLIGFADLQFQLGRILNYPELLTNVDALLQKCLGELSEDHPDQIRCFDLLGSITLATNDVDSCIRWCQKSLEMKKKILSSNDQQLVLPYDLLAFAFLRKNDNAQALDALKEILKIHQQNLGDQHCNLIPYYARMIQIYESEAQFNEVLLCYNQVYSIMLRNVPIDDVNLAPIYHNMGNTFASLSQYPLALGYYQTSLDIKLKHLSPESESIALSYKNIGLVYKYMNNIDHARMHFQKAMEIYRQLPSSTDQTVLEIEQLIQTLSATPS